MGKKRWGVVAFTVGVAVALWQPAWGYETTIAGRSVKINGFVESLNIFRSKGFTRNPILTQQRNTAETEIDVTLAEDWDWIKRMTLFFDGRFFYDGVYDMNDNDFGNDAGDPLPGLPDPIPGFGPNRGFRLLGKRPYNSPYQSAPMTRAAKFLPIWPTISMTCASASSCTNCMAMWSSPMSSARVITCSCASASSRSSGGAPICFACWT